MRIFVAGVLSCTGRMALRRGILLTATGRVDEAEIELAALQAVVADPVLAAYRPRCHERRT